MRMWRNWQTHKTKDLMKLLRAGSSPVIRTKLDPVEPIRFGWVFLFAFLWAITMTLRSGDFTLNLFLLLIYRILLPFSGSGCSTSQREYQLHRENKYLKIEYLSKSRTQYRVWLFFYFYDTFFRYGFYISVDIIHRNSI